VTNDVNAYWNPHNTSLWPTGTARRLNAVKRRKISNGSTAYAATEYTYDSPYSRGNVTAEKRWDSVKSPSLPALGQLSLSNSQVLSRVYDSYGNLTDIYEPEVRTHITYDAAANVVTRVDTGYGTSAQRSMQYSWLYKDAAIGSKTDIDNNLTTSFTYDHVGRQLTMTEGSLRRTVTSYDDVNRKVATTGDLRTYMDGKLQTVTHYDQLGRVNLVQKSDGAPLNGGTDGIKVLTLASYPEGGRRVVTSAPYRNFSDPMLEWTCTQYDLLGRVMAVAMFKGAAAPTNCTSETNRTGNTGTLYDAEWTTVTDPAGKARKQKRDGLGRLVQVIEDPSGLNFSTVYTYDPLDNLIQVTQGAQPRTFVYSSLSRLRSAANPESGTITYTYNDSGDLLTRTDARGKVSTMTYDPLHRILTKSYSDNPTTPNVTYAYHPADSSLAPSIGQLKSVSSSAASTMYSSYNALGQVTTSMHSVSGYAGNSAVFSYDYWLNGSLKTLTYPSGRTVNYSVDDAGRSNKVDATARTYVDTTTAGITYPFTPDGRIAQAKLNDNLWETRDFNTPGTATIYRLRSTVRSGDRVQLQYDFSGTLYESRS